MQISLRAYDKDTTRLIENIQIDNPKNPYPTIEGYTRDPRFEINLGSDLLDKEGRRIFEGDIIEIDEDWKKRMGFQRFKTWVQFINGSFMFNSMIFGQKADTLLFQTAPHCKVIGEKYHNINLVELKRAKRRKKRKNESGIKSKAKGTVSK